MGSNCFVRMSVRDLVLLTTVFALTMAGQRSEALAFQGGCVDGQACLTDAECAPGLCVGGACVCKCSPAGDEDCWTTLCDGTTFVEFGSEQAVKDAGRLQVEGKDYVVSDGDMMHVLFNV